MAFIEIDGLEKSYGATSVLKGINLAMEEGGFLVLVGPSGCGKSTLLNTIAGLETITKGEIRIDGRKVNDLRPADRDIAMVFQSYALYPNMTVRQNMAFGLEMRKVAKPTRDKAVAEVADVLKIAHLLDRKPSQLSGGQRQRVAMGRALVRKPKLFLFDEPLSNLDAKLRVDMRTEIKRLHSTLGTTIVYVTHDQIEAMTLASRIAVLKDGLLQQFGAPSEIYNDPVNMFVADFMGSPPMNLIPAELVRSGNSVAASIARDDGAPVALAIAPDRAPSSPGNGKIILGIRPEAITDLDGADRNARNVVRAECKAEVVEPAGSDTFVITRLGGKYVVARMRSDASVKAGSMVSFAFNMDRAVMFDPGAQTRIA
jgi:multiple sugar transport system ATP-binding protein